MSKLMSGTVTPPKDMLGSALKTLGQEQFEVFIKKYGKDFTSEQLVKFNEELRYGTRSE